MDVNSFTHRAAEALATAQREARSNDHQRIEPEHLLVALLADPDGVVYPVVRRAGADPGPEAKYQALERFGRDLTDMARQGKLDPVIGRDDEVRRVVQVLSRRTK